MKGGEVIQLVGLVGSVISKVKDVIERDRQLRGEVRRGLEYIWRDMRMVTKEIESSGIKNQGAAHEAKILLLRDLALDIEDFIDTTWSVSRACGLISQAIGVDGRQQLLQEIYNFKESVQRVRDWKPDPSGDGRGQQQDSAVGAATWWLSPSAVSAAPCNQEASIKPRAERIILSWLRLPAQDLRVISIVGRRGVGKTALASAVYVRYSESNEYNFRAWVVASACSNREDLLWKVLNNGSTCLAPVETSLRHYLHDKRYLVVIDDVDHAEVWKKIKDEFPDNGNSSRIIVTTSIHSVAAECSRGCYVYRMHGLEDTEAKDIFWNIVGQESRSPALELASDGVLKKCGNLPLALNNAAHYLRQKGGAASCVTGGLTKEQCQRAARELGDMVLNGKAAEFVRTNRALLQCYNGLPDYIHRSCLLYASVFPRGRSINSKVAIRRWIAEGLIAAHDTLTDEEVASGCLYEFIDRSIVEPVLISNATVSKFRVYSIMLEFIIHKAVSENFVALVDEGQLLHNKENVCARGQSTRGPICGARVRRLSVQNSEKEAVDRAANYINLSAMRSLTIYRSHLLDLQSSKLLRVLDLGGCKGVKDIVRGGICKLHFLKYLSLRGTDVVILPKEMKQLDNLETLDVRDTSVNVIPIEVIRLPFLAHLLGRFELPRGITGEMLKRSQLKTLAGVEIGEADYSFENIILHSRELKKVKIYQTTSGFSDSLPNKRARKIFPARDRARASTSNSTLLQLKGRFTGSNPLQILSIDSSDFSKEFLGFLEAPCAITSIKLRGKLNTLPHPVTLGQLADLNKLLLISTCLSSEHLSALQYLRCLEYLKLAEHSTGFWAGSFVVHDGGFPSLTRLCLEAEKLPQMIFRPGSMQSLTILDLFCPYPDVPEFGQERCCSDPCQNQDHKESKSYLSVQGISNITRLNEVILHHSTKDRIMQAWSDIAIRHKNKPSVKRQAKPQR